MLPLKLFTKSKAFKVPKLLENFFYLRCQIFGCFFTPLSPLFFFTPLHYNRTKSLSTFKQLIIGIIYRHPNVDEFEFLSDLEYCLTKLFSDKKDFFILGDININIFPTGRTSLATDYVNLVHNFGDIFLITEPTGSD